MGVKAAWLYLFGDVRREMNDTAAVKAGSTIGVGSPGILRLNQFGMHITDAFDAVPYLVGSAARGKQWRDVDVRLILDDAVFDALFPGQVTPHWSNARWSLLCDGLSAVGRSEERRVGKECRSRWSP